MTRVLEENYYELAYLGWMVKTNQISQPVVIHNQPEFYGLSDKDAINSRIRYLRAEFNAKTQEFNAIKGEYLRGTRPYGYIGMNSLQAKIDKLSKAIHFLRARLKGEVVNQVFDLTALKQIPLNQITEILPSGFFKNNPFRTEKSPSNSLHWNKNNNTWYDFASNRHGDSVDLFMAINSCTFRQACKELSTM